MLAAQSEAQLEGRVLDPAGAAVAGAEVRALLEERVIGSATTDGAGRWRIGGLGGGDYLLLCSSGHLASGPLGPVPLAPGETLGGLDLHLEAAATLAGTVRDGATGATIEGARLEAAGLVATSDRAGRFRLAGLPAGPVILRAGAKGYERRTQPLVLEGRAVTGLELHLRRGATVRGTVLDGERKVAGALVRALRYRLESGGDEAVLATSGPDGSFLLDAPAGLVEIEAVAADGRTGRSAPLDLVPGASAEGIEVHLDTAAELAGRVVDAAGNGAPFAEVRAASLAGAILASAAADAAGRFAFATLPAGLLRVVAQHGGATGLSAPVAAGGPEVIVRLGAGSLAGSVVDAAGNGVPGAQLVAWAEGAPRAAAAVVGSDGQGAFRFEGLPDGPLRVEAVHEGRRAEARNLFPGGTPLRLVLGSGHLVGVVHLAGRPATDFTVAASPAEPGRAGGTAQRLVSPDGSFRLPLPPGRYEVRAGVEGGGTARALAEVPGAGDSDELLLEIAEGGVVEGVVREEGSGAPIPGVRLSLERTRTFAFGQAGDVPGAPQAVSGADGAFRLGGLPTGRRVPIFAWKPGYRPTRPAVVEPAEGRAERLEIVLTPGENEGEQAFGGVGITLGAWRGALVAADVVEGGPGWEAGVRRGDRILAVDGAAVDAKQVGAVAERIRGPVGTPVLLDLVRGESYFRAAPLRAELRF